ncbi:MAG: transporter substrate-binding domain-containing protein, partial [Bacteroidota bacterium]
ISITDERKKQMSFSPTFLNNIDVMVTHKDVPTLTSLQTIDSEFKGKTAYSIPSTTYYHTIESLKKESFPSLVIKPVQTPIDVLNKASSDENSFGYVDFILYLRSLENRKSIKRHPIADVASDQYGIAMPLKSDWASIIKDFFDTGYLQSLDYRKAITNHIGNQALRMVK